MVDGCAAASVLADAVARSIPWATPWHWVALPRVPAAGEGTTGHCKRCGRALPVFSDPLAFGPMGRLPVVRFERSLMESALLCLVCGPRSRSAQPLGADAILAAGAEIAAVLSARHWWHWSRRLRAALGTEGESPRIEQVGQALEPLRRFGPGRYARKRNLGGDPLEILVVSSAALWPTG